MNPNLDIQCSTSCCLQKEQKNQKDLMLILQNASSIITSNGDEEKISEHLTNDLNIIIQIFTPRDLFTWNCMTCGKDINDSIRNVLKTISGDDIKIPQCAYMRLLCGLKVLMHRDRSFLCTSCISNQVKCLYNQKKREFDNTLRNMPLYYPGKEYEEKAEKDKINILVKL